ncbi:TraK family protein [Enterobacter ludwigii]|uniref:hypothetical protein n=1 Tax=Enterobacter ludwigii TaxID=299767 RepID=UPI002430547F|nr:hypothetical protein [Enterobacter ludwigii]WGC19195.1 TraK family protein [Enterobacter ludwigii]
MMGTPKVKLPGAGRVAFLARLDEFRGLIEAGWPITVVYEHHGGDNTGLSYSQFARYVGKYIRKPAKRGIQQPTIPDEISNKIAAISEKTQSSGTSTSQPPILKSRARFQHNPNSGNDRDDLI